MITVSRDLIDLSLRLIICLSSDHILFIFDNNKFLILKYSKKKPKVRQCLPTAETETQVPVWDGGSEGPEHTRDLV